MKKVFQVTCCLLVCGFLVPLQGVAEPLENRLKVASAEGGIHTEGDAGVKSLNDRIRRLEAQMKEKEEPRFGKWGEWVALSGLIEAEAGYERLNFADPDASNADASDLSLATVELGIDAAIARHVGGHILFLWEEDDTEPVDIDEGFIILDGADVVPLYLNAGKMYVPFGYFESHFISDPLTLELGETRESALRVGFANDMVDLSVASFNGDVDEAGADDHVESFVGSARMTLPEGTVPGVGLVLGASYISNMAESDGLEGEIPGEIADSVGGLGGFLSLSFIDRFFFEAEYVGALDEFQGGELSFDGGEALKPAAWNFEFAVVPADDWEVAVKYEGGKDLGDFLPEEQYGGTVAYSLFENTVLAMEYLHGEFENGDERDTVTAQLAITF